MSLRRFSACPLTWNHGSAAAPMPQMGTIGAPTPLIEPAAAPKASPARDERMHRATSSSGVSPR